MKELKFNFLNFITMVAVVVFLTACSGNKEPQTPQYNTGTKKTQEWKDYNKYAKKNTQPILDFFVTTNEDKHGDDVPNNFDTFDVDDPYVSVQTKWHNCKKKDLYEFKFYMPDGRLYHYDYFKSKKKFKVYNIGRHLPIRNTPTSEIVGKWTIEVIVNKKSVVKKNFNIGKTSKKYTRANPTVKIGFSPYIHSKEPKWKRGKLVGIYTSMATLVDNPNIKIVPTKLILKKIRNSNFNYKNFKSQIIEDLNDTDGIILPIANKYKMDYIITGKAKSAPRNNSFKTSFETYIIDVNKKKIIDTINTDIYFSKSAFERTKGLRLKGVHPLRGKLYDKLYENLKYKIKNLSK